MRTSSRDEIANEIRRTLRPDRIDGQRYAQLGARLSKQDPLFVGDALLSYWQAETRAADYLAQELVASLLLVLNPPTAVPLRQLLLGLSEWNVSVEEYPWYLWRQFGREAVLRELGLLENELATEAVFQERANTLRYWLQASLETIEARARQLAGVGKGRDILDQVEDLLEVDAQDE